MKIEVMKNSMMYATSLVSILIFSGATPSALAATREENVKTLFAQVNKSGKGALGANTYQRPNGRSSVLQNGGVSGAPRDTLYTVAYRSETARKLAALDFYVGNRFTSSYYELYAKYLATPEELKNLALKMDLPKFLAKSEMAQDARSIARHTLLEQFYMRKFPQTTLTRANLSRGTADADNEQTYYSYFVQYLAGQVATSQDYLNLYELQKRYNLTGDNKDVSLSKVRDTVASLYDQFALEYPDAPFVREFKAIRNSIHNYLTPVVVTNLSAFIKRYNGQIADQEMRAVIQLRDQLNAYYHTDRKTLLAWATKLTAHLPINAVSIITALNEPTLARLEALSQLLKASRESFMTYRDPEVIHFMIRVNQFLQNQLSARGLSPQEDWAARARIALDATYASGLVTSENWFVVRQSLEAPRMREPEFIRARLDDFALVFTSAAALVRETMQPALADWIAIDKSMDGFVDDTLRSSLLTELDQLSTFLKKNIPAQSTAPYSIETAGEAIGYLTYVSKDAPASELEKLDKTMVVIFAELPLDLGVTAAIITEQPQTPLSHVNIKSKSRGTPNAYFPKASQSALLKELLAKKALVKISMKDGKISVRTATLDEAKAFWTKMRAPVKVDVNADLSETRIRSTKELRSSDVLTVGAKAANYGEAESVLGEGTVREALSVPFSYYKSFMDTNRFDATQTLSEHVDTFLADPRTLTDRTFLVEGLKAIQERMIADDMVVDATLLGQLNEKLGALYPGKSVKFRSSSNSEDLANFSGAGLYDSYSYDPTKPKKTIALALKKTWASVWNLRAFDERDLFGINHKSVYMAMLVSPSYSNELANGVAISRNTVDISLGKGMYINTQLGEELVTNPDPTIYPEELLILDHADAAKNLPYTLKYLKYSKLNSTGPILTNDEAISLAKSLAKLSNHFRTIFDPQNKNPKFAIDIEFKLDSAVNGQRGIFIKQARPYVAR